MIIHSVYFWLDGLDAAARAAFRRDLEAVAAIASVVWGHIGTPAATPERPVIDASYDEALVVAFDDLAGHDAYQADPAHDRFLAHWKERWSAVRIYDIEV